MRTPLRDEGGPAGATAAPPGSGDARAAALWRPPAGPRTEADDAELHAVEAGIDPVRGLHGPGTLAWRVFEDAALHLGGLRALLLQVAHPKVAAGVAAHSDFRRHPLRRASRTFAAMYALFFGDAAEARRAGRGVRGVHTRVTGTLGAPASGDPDPAYRASDPALLLWVFTTLIEATIFVHATFLDPLGEASSAELYRSVAPAAVLLGIPRRCLPPDLAAFRAYFDRMVDHELEVTPDARAIIDSLLADPIAHGAMRLPLHVLAAGTLPARIRVAYALPWTPATRLAYRGAAAATRALLHATPSPLRRVPQARAALARCRAAGARS